MIKLAAKPETLMSYYVAFLRALYIIHQNHHWQTKGKYSYAEHLLFQRIYEAIQEMTDEAAEKCIGVYGELEQQNISDIISAIIKGTEDKSYVEISLIAEKKFQDLAKKTYDALKASGTLTLGLDDMIMSHASNSEVHTYLLQQAL